MAPMDWKVFVEQPLVYIRLQSTGYYAFTLGLMLLAFGGAVLGAGAFSRRVTRPLEEVVGVVRNISAHGSHAEATLTEVSAGGDCRAARGRQRHAHAPGRIGTATRAEQALIQRERLNTELRARSTEDLDRKVRERTVEVAPRHAWPRRPTGPRASSWPT